MSKDSQLIKRKCQFALKKTKDKFKKETGT